MVNRFNVLQTKVPNELSKPIKTSLCTEKQ